MKKFYKMVQEDAYGDVLPLSVVRSQYTLSVTLAAVQTDANACQT